RDPRGIPEVSDDPGPQGRDRPPRPGRGLVDRPPTAGRPDIGPVHRPDRRPGARTLHDARPGPPLTASRTQAAAADRQPPHMAAAFAPQPSLSCCLLRGESGRSKGSRCETRPKAAREPYFEYGERTAEGATKQMGPFQRPAPRVRARPPPSAPPPPTRPVRP